MTACPTPLPWDRLVAYWADDLEAAEAERLEEHLFGCATCTEEAGRVARIAQAIRNAPAVVVTPADVASLRARGLAVEENRFVPGRRQEVVFGADVDVLVHHLTGLELAGAERVHVTVRVESTGDVLFEDHFVPFDPESGVVLVACQRHYAALARDVVFDVHAHRAARTSEVATFVIPHVFPVASHRS